MTATIDRLISIPKRKGKNWNILNSLGLFQGILFDGQPLALLPNAILTAVLGLGLAFVVWQRRAKPSVSLAGNQ